MAKVIVARRRQLPQVEARIAKHGPWTNLILVLAAVYGPRLVMLWKALSEEHNKKARPLAIIPALERAEAEALADPDLDPGQKVN